LTVTREERLIAALAGALAGVRHVAVGASSPIPAAAALLAALQAGGTMRVSILGSRGRQAWSDTGVELFDCAAQGRLDAFFLGGGQIDGRANLNLVGTSEGAGVRWPGSFGSAFLYFAVPRVILFREEHSRRVLVPEVDFVSAPGTSPPHVWRRGGPCALVTSLCRFDFDPTRGFVLASVHPGHTVDEVRARTGFDFEAPATVPFTPAPGEAALALVRGPVRRQLADAYPRFAARLGEGG
jgi:glutaconate CoA-transferase, subunit B